MTQTHELPQHLVHFSNEIYKPRIIFWELTEGCNLKCIHCRATAQPIRAKDELTTKQAFDVVEQVSELGNPILILTGGEPLYRPDFFEIASYANKKGITLAMASNGTLINEKVAQKIKQSGIRRVAISFDGPSPSIHDKFRGLPGSFDDALRGLKTVQSIGIQTQMNTTITKHNVDHVEKMLQLAEYNNVDALHLFMLVPVGCGVEIVEENMLTAEEYEDVLSWFYEKSREVSFEIRATCAPHYYRIMREKAKEKGERITRNAHGMSAVTKGCLAGSGVFFISHKGRVRPCGYLPLEAGNLLEQPLQTIWNDSELFHILRSKDSLEGKCGVCEFVNVCSGCRARAYYETGNMMTDEPYCTYQPKRNFI
ncbi:radical SAM protein [Evansella sp. AB-rgal1]|uniref:radical SAM protein n=1 Tax=Evansella sp. AB-rgal1 TaxID=3242696 RepID=UPI00359E9448